MWLLTGVLSIFLSIFSTIVMSYVSMATPIGPWIASTLVLIAMITFKVMGQHENVTERMALAVSAGSVGGIIATALGFSFPTLYFLDPILFNSWMRNPTYFIAVVTAFSLVAGWFGIWIANVIEDRLIVQEELAFPIGQLIYRMITAQQQVRKAWELAFGFVTTVLFCAMQDGVATLKALIPKSITLLTPRTLAIFSLPHIVVDLWPMLWAIGFVTGDLITLPLAVGALSRIVVVDPINTLFFPAIKNIEFMLAFCSGMVLASAVQGLVGIPKVVGNVINKVKEHKKISGLRKSFFIELALLLVCVVTFLTYFEFSPAMQIYLLVFSFVCTYQMASIAGKIGLAQLGRFATFVMVPAIFIFQVTSVQIVLIATFVELCGGVAVDILFGRKMASMGNISRAKMKAYQYLGLLVGACSVGIVFWVLINHFKLGSPELFAYKAQSRQLLLNVKSFDYVGVFVGGIFGLFLKYMKMNPMFVLGGLLMPLTISIGLMIGGIASACVSSKQDWYPFWSGVFAANSVWMMIRAVF